MDIYEEYAFDKQESAYRLDNQEIIHYQTESINKTLNDIMTFFASLVYENRPVTNEN